MNKKISPFGSLLLALLFSGTNLQAEQPVRSIQRVGQYLPMLSDRNYSLKDETTDYVPSAPPKISDDELEEILDHLKRAYERDVDVDALRKKAKQEGVPAMLKSLDPHTEYLRPEPARGMQTEAEGMFGGLGIRIDIKDGQLNVMTPIPETPAYRAGILPGDIITEIEGESTEGITLQDAVRKLRGYPNTSVAIKVLRGKETKVFTLTREIIAIESVLFKIIQSKIGYIKMREFSARTNRDLFYGLKRLKEQGMESLILDLRNNPGGLMNVAISVARKFLGGKKLIVYTEGRRMERIEYRADETAPFESIPLVILVNKGTAGGAELLAGVLQEYGRAKIVGSKTFGKASIQSVIPLSKGGALRLTTQYFYTPKGRKIQYDEKTGAGGIAPDFALEIGKEDEVKLQKQEEQIYALGKGPVSIVTKEEQIEDPFLKKALELLR